MRIASANCTLPTMYPNFHHQTCCIMIAFFFFKIFRQTMRGPTGGAKIGFCENCQRQGHAGKRIWMGSYISPAGSVLLRWNAHHQEARAHCRTLRGKVRQMIICDFSKNFELKIIFCKQLKCSNVCTLAVKKSHQCGWEIGVFSYRLCNALMSSIKYNYLLAFQLLYHHYV